MPELPEVETTRLGLFDPLVSNQIDKVWVRNPSLRWPVSPEIYQLDGNRITALNRRGKYLQFEFEKGQMLVHLGMSGSLRLLQKPIAPGPHDHLDWQLVDGRCLRFTDPRRFGSVLWNTQGNNHPLLRHLGPEPLTDALSGEYLAAAARGRKRAVKPFLMDAQILVGVGNIYAQESLFLAGIHPARSVARISITRWRRLAKAIKQVLKKALTAGGTTLQDFSGADGKPGYFDQSLQVYGRGGRNCHICGRQIKQTRLGQRQTCYCPGCQH